MLPFANVLLVQSEDSSLVRGTVADEADTYQLTDLPTGQFLLSATSVDYQPAFRGVNVGGDQTVNFRLSESTTQLENVEVTAQRPLPEQQNHSLRIGLDYQLSPKTVVGFLVNGYNNTFTLEGDIEGASSVTSLLTQHS